MYQFEYKLNNKDYLEFDKYHMIHDQILRKEMLFSVVILGTIMEAIYIFFSWESLSDAKGIAIFFLKIIFGILGIILLCLYRILFIFAVRKLGERLEKRYAGHSYGETHRIQFEDEFFIETTDKVMCKRKYSRLRNVTVSKHAAYLYLYSPMAIVLPFRVFETTEQKESFLQFIRQKIEVP